MCWNQAYIPKTRIFGKGETVTFRWSLAATPQPSKWSRLISLVISHVDIMFPWCVMRGELHLCDILSSNPQPYSSHEKPAKKRKSKTFYQILTFSKTVKVWKSKESLENLLQIGGKEDIPWQNVTWWSGPDPGTENGHYRGSWWNPNQVWSSGNGTVPILIS